MKKSYEDYLKIVDEYVEGPSTGFALSIRGDWGVGKTYFIKTILDEHLTKTKDSGIIYVSLNGLSKTSDIYKRMISSYLAPGDLSLISLGALQSLTELGIRKFGEGIGSQLKTLEEKLSEKVFQKISDKVICFDDLERINFKTLDYVELFGYINTEFLEQRLIKTIFISNSEMIQHKQYPQIREKYIYRDILFEPDLDNVFDNVANMFVDQKLFYDYIITQKEVIIDLLRRAAKENIRTLKYFVDSYSNIYKNLPSDVVEEDVLSTLIFAFMCSSEYKSGAFDTFSDAEKMFPKSTFELINRLEIKKMVEEESKKKNLVKIEGSEANGNAGSKLAEKDPSIIFYEKYIEGYRDEYKYYGSILKYIIEGILDTESLSSEVKNNSSKNQSEHQLVYQRLLYFKTLTDEEFKKELKSLEKHLLDGSFSIYEIPAVAHNLYFFDEQNLLDIEVDNILNKAIEKSMENYEYDFFEFDSFKHHHSFKNNKSLAIQAKIEKLLQDQAEKQLKTDFDIFYNSLFKDESIDKSFYRHNQFLPIFNYISPDVLMEKIKSSSNKANDLLVLICKAHLENPPNWDYIKIEKSNLAHLVGELQQYLVSGDIGEIKKILIGEMIELIDTALKNIS